MNRWIVLGMPVGSLISAALLLEPDRFGLAVVLFGFVLLQLLGSTLILSGVRRAGAILVLVGNLAFVPAGLIGALGARRLLDDLARDEFELRRRES